MRWKTGRRSQNVQDRRGRGGFGGSRGGYSRGGGSSMVVGGGGLGMVIFAIVIALLGGDPTILLDSAVPTGQSPGGAPYQASSAEEDAQAEFVSVVLADTEDTWNSIFPQEFGDRKSVV